MMKHPAWCARTEGPDEVHESAPLFASEEEDFIAVKVQRVQAEEGDDFPLLVLTMRQDGEEAQYALSPEQVRRMAEVFDDC